MLLVYYAAAALGCWLRKAKLDGRNKLIRGPVRWPSDSFYPQGTPHPNGPLGWVRDRNSGLFTYRGSVGGRGSCRARVLFPTLAVYSKNGAPTQ
jgi:hypothetical protein